MQGDVVALSISAIAITAAAIMFAKWAFRIDEIADTLQDIKDLLEKQAKK